MAVDVVDRPLWRGRDLRVGHLRALELVLGDLSRATVADSDPRDLLALRVGGHVDRLTLDVHVPLHATGDAGGRAFPAGLAEQARLARRVRLVVAEVVED